jgi:hypothetical protein
MGWRRWKRFTKIDSMGIVMQREYGFDELDQTDLIVDALYRGGTVGNTGDDPLHLLVGGGNQGGIRYIKGSCSAQ